MSTEPKLEMVLAMAERLIAIFEADIKALEAAQPRAMKSLEPDNQQLILAYTKEAQRLSADTLKAAPAPLRQRLTAVTARFRETLARHTRMVVRVKNASEGLIKAVADEVEKRRNRAKPYTAAATPSYGAAKLARPAASALLFNAVV